MFDQNGARQLRQGVLARWRVECTFPRESLRLQPSGVAGRVNVDEARGRGIHFSLGNSRIGNMRVSPEAPTTTKRALAKRTLT